VTANLFSGTFLNQAGEDFLATKLGYEFMLVNIGDEAVKNLLTWSDLNEILSTCPLSAPRLRLTLHATDIPVELYTRPVMSSGEQRRALIPDKLYGHLRNGATLILEAIDRLHPPIRQAVDDLVRMVREATQANLYLVWGEEGGFGTHWDDHDTFIVQVAGAKHWIVHGPATHRYPMAEEADRSHTCPDSVVWQGVLRPGQVMHVPRGWWHTVRGVGGWSAHLTFGYTRATGMSWIRWLLDQAINDPAFRQDLPRFATRDERAAHHSRLVDRLAELASIQGIDAFLADRDARMPRRQRVSLPWAVQSGKVPSTATVEFAPLLASITRTGETVTLTAAGRVFRFAAVAEPVLERLVAQRQLQVADLQQVSSLPDHEFGVVLSVLAREHLVLIHE
jgi:Cupin superfamily protein